MATLHCVVASPEGLVFEGDARSVVVPAIDGELGILPRHAPLIASLGQGELRVKLAGASGGSGKAMARFFLEGGFVQVMKDQVMLLPTAAESLDTMEVAAAEEKVRALVESRPDWHEPYEAREKHAERLRVAKLRAKLVQRRR